MTAVYSPVGSSKPTSRRYQFCAERNLALRGGGFSMRSSSQSEPLLVKLMLDSASTFQSPVSSTTEVPSPMLEPSVPLMVFDPGASLSAAARLLVCFAFLLTTLDSLAARRASAGAKLPAKCWWTRPKNGASRWNWSQLLAAYDHSTTNRTDKSVRKINRTSWPIEKLSCFLFTISDHSWRFTPRI